MHNCVSDRKPNSNRGTKVTHDTVTTRQQVWRRST